MTERKIALVRELCHEVDMLVTLDPGTGDLGVLEQARLMMNDHLAAERWIEAENTACAILQYHSGNMAKQFILEVLAK